MLKNYIKIAFRNFRRHKLFTFINVIGLSIGITAALVIYLIVQHDFNFDKFHPNGNRIYRVVTEFSFSGEKGCNSGVCSAMPYSVKAEIAGIQKAAPFFILSQFSAKANAGKAAEVRIKNQDNVVLTDSRYFDLFKYKWLAGSAKKALDEPNTVVITSDQAKIYFPKLSFGQVLGKEIVYEDSIRTVVTGVVQSFTHSTDLKFHDFISYGTAKNIGDIKHSLNPQNWGGTSSASQLFVELPAGSNKAEVEQQINGMFKRHYPSIPQTKNFFRAYHLQPLNDLHFNGDYGSLSGNTASKTTLYGLLIIASFILILGCINFINLSTAQASQRAKEIGIRKTIGSSNKQLIALLLSETFLITLLAVVISVIATPFILILFKDFISADIKFNIISQPSIFVFLLLLTIVVSLLSGFYPAVVLSGYKPVQVLKNQSNANKGTTRSAVLRKSLTVTQFIIAQFFIMATMMVGKQTYYAIHKDMGFKKDAILYISTPWKNNNENQKQLFANQLNAIPQIALVSRGNDAPSSNNTNSTEATYKDGKKEIKLELQRKYGDANYIRLYHIKLLAGRDLQQADTGKAFLINATYASMIGFKNVRDAVGKSIDNYNGDTRMEIAGVVADFHQESLHAPIKPLAVEWYPNKYNNGIFHVALKPQTAGGNEWKSAISSMEKAWKVVYPDADFEYQFVDQNIAKFYQSEQHTSQLLAWATGISIFISCLGLLGLAMYTTTLRTKEIGVRKVLGATVAQIVTILSTELVGLVLLAFVVVTPVAIWAINTWLQNFADRTAISWWIFALSGGGMMLTALLTLSMQTVKAAIANPIKGLRSE